MTAKTPFILCQTSVGRWAVRRFGLKVEVSLTYKLLDDPAEFDELFSWKEVIYSVHLPFELSGRRLNIAARDDQWRRQSLETLRLSLEAASRLEAKKVVIHAAPRFWDGMVVGDYDRLIDGLRQVAAEGDRRDLPVCVENNRTYWDGCDPADPVAEIDREKVNTYFGVTPAEWKKLVEDTGHSNLRLCLDTSHAVTAAQTVSSFDRRVDVMREFLAAGAMISHVHWNDNYLFDNRGRADAHLPLNGSSVPIDVHRSVSKLEAALLLERAITAEGLVAELEFIDKLDQV